MRRTDTMAIIHGKKGNHELHEKKRRRRRREVGW
jgi:hypothetical protein